MHYLLMLRSIDAVTEPFAGYQQAEAYHLRLSDAIDGRWEDAKLDEPLGPHAWRGWRYAWDATPGQHVLACRATSEDGDAQPSEPPWNVQGMANDLIQGIPVTVREPEV